MASIALLTESTAVHVISAMTADTHTGLLVGPTTWPMTGFANKSLVCADESKFGLLGVVKAPEVPPHRVVAIVAALTECAIVRILCCMTGHTGIFLRGVLEGRMALFAGRRPMHAYQREAGEIVLESRDFRPLRLLMAIGTFDERCAMRIINGMTVATVGR